QQWIGTIHRARAIGRRDGDRQRGEESKIFFLTLRQESPLRNVMKGFIVLLRHGIAEDRSADKPDADRKLTDVGKRRMKRIAKTLARIFPEAEALYSSPLVRAVETSQAVEKAYGGEIGTETTELLE